MYKSFKERELGYLLIFFARVCDVTLATIRTIMVVQGRKGYAALIGFFEIIIYITALGTVMKNLNNVGNILAYALGYSAGNYVGITIEDRIALGNSTVQIIVNKNTSRELASVLRESGYGVTVLDGHGRDDDMDVLMTIIDRKKIKEIRKIIEEVAPKAFVTVNSTTIQSGGYFLKKK